MKKDVLIQIKGKYSGNEGDDVMELTTIGSFTRMDGNYYITYRESEATGLDGTITTVKVEGSRRVTLMRRGAQQSRLVIEKGKRHLCAYETGYGSLMVGIFAEKIHSTLHEKGGEIDFRYTLDVNADFASRNEVQITVKEAGGSKCPM